MDRRSFFRGAGVATVAAAASALAAPAIAQERRELRMATPWPAGLPGLEDSVKRLARRIGDMTDGRITIVPFAAGELVPQLEEFAATSDGRADLFHAPDYYYASVSPALNFFTNTPLGLTAVEHAAWLRFGGGQELWDRHHARFGIKPLLAGDTGTQMAGWFKQPIERLGDLSGLNFRMFGLGGEVWRRLGMNVVGMPGSEILAALQDGRLDGTDWIGPWNDLALGLHQAASHYYFPSLAEGSAALSVGVNAGVWDSLSAADRAIFQIACAAEHQTTLAEFHYNNGIALDELTASHDVSIHRLPDDVIAAVAEAAPAVIADTAGADPLSNEIVASIEAARRSMRRWTEIGEAAFVAARADLSDRD